MRSGLIEETFNRYTIESSTDQIDQNGITGLNLVELDVSFNPKIVDVSFMMGE